MVSAENGNTKDEIQEDLRSAIVLNHDNDKDQNVQAAQNGNMNDKNPLKKFLDMGHIFSRRSEYTKFRSPGMLASPSASFRKMAEERDTISRSVKNPADADSPRHSLRSFARKINWDSLMAGSKKWFRNPVNVVLFLWILFVAVSGAILFMVMTGMLNHVLPKKSQRDVWFEVNNQILNALFTLMCLYQHPRRFYHLALLCRWKPEDVLVLRKIYCKNGSYKPHEWMHMMVVVILLHVNCFAQYALCGLNLGYTRSKRPAIGVGLCISVAIGAPVVATVYNILSPLGKEYETESDNEGQSQATLPDEVPSQPGFMSPERKYCFRAKDQGRSAVQKPQWAGGLFDLWDDISLAYLSLFCSFCVFGWNMDRLGFGNMYVHIVTFVLLCVAPFWIFNLAAINIDNEVVREALGYTGILLCVFGLLYGGFWRIQMRRRYNLPANNFCCNSPAATDCFQWLCCCFCSLAQETRTIDLYEIEVHKRQGTDGGASGPAGGAMSPLPREDGIPLFRSGPSSPLWTNSSPFITTVRSAPSSPLWTSSSPFVTTVNSASPGTFIDTHAIDVRLPVHEGGASPVMQPPVPSLMQ